MAEAAALAALGWVASPLMKMLFDKAHKLLGTSIDEKREILAASTLPRLCLAMEKAEMNPKKYMLEAWLKRLKNAYYQAEDAIDLLEYQQLNLKVMEDRKTLTQTLKSEVEKLTNSTSEILTGHIDKIIQIANETEKFIDLLKDLENGSTCNPDRVTTSQPLGRVFGLEDHKNTVVGLLMDDCIKNCDQGLEVGPSTRPIPINIIAITGRSGIGKTTLAQHIYQHMEENMFFDFLLWVHTPRKFKAIDVVKNIVQTIQKKNDALDEGNYDSSAPLEALREQMHGKLCSKKFLLVLDDFWCDDENFIKQWEKFISCLRGLSPGSKILLTTQYKLAEEQASLAGETEVMTHTLGELRQDHLLELFMHHAWPSNNSMQRENFQNIGRDIVSKLKGDPGATKMVGRQLRNKLDIMHWENIAKKNWSVDDKMEARIWSYQQLPVHLQRCFAFCSLFPKGFLFSVSFLIELWMAEGFIDPIDEDAGENYVNELVSLFFLEKQVNYGTTYYGLHDLLHDLAERVKGDDFVRIDYTNTRIVLEDIKQKLSRSHENIRHISLPTGRMIIKLKDEICLMKNLCTLICIGNNLHIQKKDLREILENLQKLRVLHLPSCGCELPDSIGNLKHLRNLHFGGSSFPLNKLPTSICKLYLLQALYLPGCQSLPKEFSQLIRLRRIFVGGEATSHISDIGRLTSLQCLDKFNVRDKTGHELHQLENLNQLKGTMCIAGLENATNINDANKANLQSKGHVNKLEFRWSSGEKATNDFQLLDALQPHSNITGLKIKWFKGNKFPNWLLCQNSTLEHLVDLQLEDCSNVEEISSIGKSLPNCEVLGLSALNNLKELPLLPPNLTSFTLSHIPQLSYFSKNDLLMKDKRKNMLEASEQTNKYMKSRYELELPQGKVKAIRRYLLLVKKRWEAASKICTHSSQCENIFQKMKNMDPQSDEYSTNELIEAMNICMHWHFETMLNKNDESKLILPSSLTRLTIESCSITNDALSTCIERLHSLSELQLVEIHTITSLPPEAALIALKKLSSLHIVACYLLSSLGGIIALSSLRELILQGCLNLSSSNKLPSSLHILCFTECSYIEDILDQSDLPVLHDLYVGEFFKIGPNCGRLGKGVLNVGPLHCLKQIAYGCSDHVCLEGLNSLTSLHRLEVHNSIRLSSPNDKCSIPIETVTVHHNPLWLTKVLSAQTLSSIEGLRICLFKGNSMDDEMFQTLKSLKRLYLERCNNITHLPVQLKDLTSLEFLGLDNCPKLHEMESFPDNLSDLYIKNIPTLSTKFNKYEDSYEVVVLDGGTLVKFRKDQTIPRPSQPTQEASTSQPTQQLSPNRQEVPQIPADQLQCSTTTAQPEHPQHGPSHPAQQPLPNPRRELKLRIPRFFRRN